MPIQYKPSKHARGGWGKSLTEPEHANELTPQAVVRKLKAGLVPAAGSQLYGYEDCSLDYITRKQKLAHAKLEAEKSFDKFVKELKNKKVKYKIPENFEDFQNNQEEFKRFADYALQNGVLEPLIQETNQQENQTVNQSQDKNQTKNNANTTQNRKTDENATKN